MNQKSLGKFVFEKRRNANLTQEELGSRIGYSPQAISKFEDGLASLSILVLPTLASTLGFLLDDIVDEGKNQAITSSVTLSIPMLARQIKLTRISLKLSQAKFAKEMGLSTRTIRNYEAGASVPPISYLLDLYDNFGIVPSKIIYLNEDLKSFDKKRRRKRRKKGRAKRR